MSAAEVVHRLGYGAYTTWERKAHQRKAFARPDRLRAALVPEIRRDTAWKDSLVARGAQRRFFALDGRSEQLRGLFLNAYEEELVKARNVANRVARHEIAFFGRTFHFGARINWHSDPVTGAEWPRGYHRDVPVSGGDIGYGDVKYVWELNRHQFLIDLAKIALLDESSPHAEAVEALLGDWLDSAPYGTGVPWACALEPAFRAWSWLWAYHMLAVSGLLTSAMHLRWLEGFLDHARFLHRHLERYSSPFNHLIGEASALFVLGLSFPEFEESARWIRSGRQILEGTVRSQFHADGGTVEQSTFYHHATLGFYILSAVSARDCDIDLNRDVWNAIERGIEFSMALVQPDGRMPSIGGADDGKPIRLEHLPFWDFRPYYAIGALLFARGDFKTAAGRFWEDALWILGPSAAVEFGALSAHQPEASYSLPASGYSVFRSGWSSDADYVCIDCGEQAAGLRRDGVPSAAHGHADCLSVVAALSGQPVLVDPGFHCYNGDPAWEVHFRKTEAHNTVSIDRRDQARHVSKMAWTHTYAATLEDLSLDDQIGWIRGSHNGYTHLGTGVTHRRTVWLRPGGYVVIYDELLGDPGHLARANFQFAPGSLSLDSVDSALFADTFELSWACSAPSRAMVFDRGELPTDGWIAPSLGLRQRAPRLVLEFSLAHDRTVLLTVLADRTRSAQGRNRRAFMSVSNSMEQTVVGGRIDGPDWQDSIVTTPGDRTIEWSGIETDAALAVVRVGRSGIEERTRIGGTVLRVSGHVDLVGEMGPPLTNMAL